MVHGGNVRQAAEHYQLDVKEWLDLSTGINPFAYSDIAVSHDAHSQLPYIDQTFLDTAKHYYDCEYLCATSGSQQAIALLPLLRDSAKVAVLSPTYSEHARAWRRAGHDVTEINQLDNINNYEVVVVTNPNNPTGRVIDSETLLNIHEQLQSRNGWLIVDEAFMDCEPHYSLAHVANQPGLIVLRSLGKFFGLAGLRVGFVITDSKLVNELTDLVGHWPLTGSAIQITQQCLQDTQWQRAMRDQLAEQSVRLNKLLTQNGLAVDGHTALFSWLQHDESADIHAALAGMGILVRYFPQNKFTLSGLRFGLPGTEENFSRLQHALELIA